MKEIREAQRAALGKFREELARIAGELENVGLYSDSSAVYYARSSLNDTLTRIEFLEKREAEAASA